MLGTEDNSKGQHSLCRQETLVQCLALYGALSTPGVNPVLSQEQSLGTTKCASKLKKKKAKPRFQGPRREARAPQGGGGWRVVPLSLPTLWHHVLLVSGDE